MLMTRQPICRSLFVLNRLLIVTLPAMICCSGSTTGPDRGVDNDDAVAADKSEPDRSVEKDTLADKSEPADDVAASDTANDTAKGESCVFDPAVKFDLLGETLQFESADGSTCLVIERQDDSVPGWMYKAVPFTLLKFAVGHEGTMTTISDPASLEWKSTHHNWQDEGLADTADTRYRFAWVVGGAKETYELSASNRASGDLQWGPIALLPYEK